MKAVYSGKSVMMNIVYVLLAIFTGATSWTVPCSRKLECQLENSQLVDMIPYVSSEVSCQEECARSTKGCVSYTWWDENAAAAEGNIPQLCLLFATCEKMWGCQNCHSGPADCGEAIIVFGGLGEDGYVETVETVFPKYETSTYAHPGYIVEDLFDEIPRSTQYMVDSTAAVFNETMVVVQGKENDIWGLDLVTGKWLEMPPVKLTRGQLVNVNGGVLKIPTGYNQGDLDVELLDASKGGDDLTWETEPKLRMPPGTMRRCVVSVASVNAIYTFSEDVVEKLDLDTNTWTIVAEFPFERLRYGYGCGFVTIDGKSGILISGGSNGTPDTSKRNDLFVIETNTWEELANTTYGQWNMGVSMLNEKLYLFGGEYRPCYGSGGDDPPEMEHYRNFGQTFPSIYESRNDWFCCIPQFRKKRARFAYVKVRIPTQD